MHLQHTFDQRSRGVRRARLATSVRAAPLLASAAVLAAAVLAGCGSSASTFGTAHIQRAIARTILAQHGLRVAVQCPPKVAKKAGTRFTCLARLQVGAYPVPAVVVGPGAKVRYENSAPLIVLDTAKVQRAIAASILAQRRLRAAVSCPAQVLQQAGVAFTCTATVARHAYPFVVTQTDAHGHVRYVGY